MFLATAFENAKEIFNNYFVKKKHLTNNPAKHDDAGKMRLAIDTQFLSMLEKEAYNNGETALADEVRGYLQNAIDELYLFHYRNGYGDQFQYPSLSLSVQAMIFARRYNYDRLTSKRQNRVELLRKNGRDSLVDFYVNEIHSPSGMTYQEVVQSQEYRKPSSYVPWYTLNIVALMGATLALDSYLIHHEVYGYSDPTSYPYRNIISEIGNYVRAMDYDTFVGAGRENKYGGGGPKASYVITGYCSWVGMAEAMMSFGTVYPSSIKSHNSSVFTSEAQEIQRGFISHYNNNNGKLYAEYYASGKPLKSTNVVGYLYPAIFADSSGNDDFRRFVDNAVHSQFEGAQDAIVKLAEQDYGKGGEAYFHRALHGLAIGMLRGIDFS